jgi:diguanylate cyclase (GGDEF)-like protein
VSSADNTARERDQLREVLAAQAELHDLFMAAGITRDWWDAALARVIRLSGSEYGFIGRIDMSDDTGAPVLTALAITDIAWNDVTRKYYDEYEATGLQFTNLDTLFGVTLRTGETVISDDPYADPRRGGMPPGHRPMNSYMGIPLKDGGDLLGMIGLANRDGGFYLDIEHELQPVISVIGQQLGRARADALASQAQQAADRLEEKVAVLSQVSDDRRAIADATAVMAATGSVAEALRIAEGAVGTLVPDARVRLFVLDSDGEKEFVHASLGSGEPDVSVAECVALQSGVRNVTRPGLAVEGCTHVRPDDTATICAPVSTKDDAFGLLVVGIREMHQLGAFDTRARLSELAVGVDALADALAQVALREHLKSQALVDPLTGLANRRGLSQAVERRLARTDLDARPFGLLLIDLDDFADVNERLGHLGGDEVLAAVGHALTRVVRDDDVVARLGGDEFAVLVPAADDVALAAAANRVRDAVRASGGPGAPATPCSLGAALVGWGPDVTWEAAYMAADAVLYASKAAGKDMATVGAMLGTPHQI